MPLDPSATGDPSDWWAWDVPLDFADDGGFGDSSEPDSETPRTGPDRRPFPFGLDKLDADADTQVSLAEWHTGFTARGVPSDDSLATFKLLDLNNDGFVILEEFEKAIGMGKDAADLSTEQATALASLTALLNAAAGGNTPAGQVATLPPPTGGPAAGPGAGVGGSTTGAAGTAPGAGLTDEQQQLVADYREWHSRYLRQTFLRVSAGGGNQGAWAGVAAGNPAFADATATDRAELTRIAVDLQTWNVTPETPPARTTDPYYGFYSPTAYRVYATNVYAEAELAVLEAKVAELNARVRAEWRFQIRLGVVGDVAGAAGLVDPTPFSNWVEGAAQFAQGHWQDGLITVGVGSLPFVGRWAVRWVRGGKTAGVVAHAEPGLIATLPGLPRQGGLNHLEPPVLGRPHFDPALGNHPPVPGTRPRPAPHEQPVPVGSKEPPPLPKPEPTPTGGGGGGGTTVPPTGSEQFPWSMIEKKVEQFAKKKLGDQIDTYNNLLKTYRAHLKKYGQTAGQTTGETARMEAELSAFRMILTTRGRSFDAVGNLLQ